MCWSFKYIEDVLFFYVFAHVTCHSGNVLLSALFDVFLKRQQNEDFVKSACKTVFKQASDFMMRILSESTMFCKEEARNAFSKQVY